MYKRTKYDYAFRLRCVQRLLKGNQSLSELSIQYGVDKSNLRLWLAFYEQYGIVGLRPRKKQFYSSSFKLKVLQAIIKEPLSLRLACVRFNIPSDSVIISWQKAYALKGMVGLIALPKGRPVIMKQPIKRKKLKTTTPLTREQELLRENEYLKAENALLKKLQALVQKDKKQKPS